MVPEKDNPATARHTARDRERERRREPEQRRSSRREFSGSVRLVVAGGGDAWPVCENAGVCVSAHRLRTFVTNPSMITDSYSPSVYFLKFKLGDTFYRFLLNDSVASRLACSDGVRSDI